MSIKGPAASAAVGGVAWAVTAFAALAAFYAVILTVYSAHIGSGSADGVRTFAALSLLVIPLAVGAAAFVMSLALLCRKWGASRDASALFGAVCSGASLYALCYIVTAFNHCELDVSLPFWWWDTSCGG